MLKHVLPVYNLAQKASLSPPPPSPRIRLCLHEIK